MWGKDKNRKVDFDRHAGKTTMIAKGTVDDVIPHGPNWYAAVMGTGILAVVLAFTYEHMVPLTIACLTLAVFLGLGTGAVFKLVAHWFPEQVGAVTGVVGAAGGLGGFFPPLVMGAFYSTTGDYSGGLLLLAATALGVAAFTWWPERRSAHA
mgnify:CR=1 FL=1